MKLLPSFEKKTKIENAKQYLLQMIQEIPGCLVSTTQCTNWMADSEGFPDKVNKQKWACEQYVAMAIQQKEFLTQSDYIGLVNILNQKKCNKSKTFLKEDFHFSHNDSLLLVLTNEYDYSKF